MLKKFALLINFFLVFNINAKEANLEEIEYDFSGFITTTQFSDNKWFNNSYKAALNFDITYDTYAIRGQIQQPGEYLFRRLTIEKDIFFNDKHDFVLKAGIFPRLNSFYNNVTDAPSTSGIAILPFGEYSHRMINNSTFSTIEGASLYYNYNTEEGHFNAHLDIGRASVEKHCDIHAEAFRTKCIQGYRFESNNNNYSIGGIYTVDKWSYLAHISQFSIDPVLTDSSNSVAARLTNNTENITLKYKKFGIKYVADSYWLQSELVFSNFIFTSVDKLSIRNYTAKNMYILGGHNWNDQLCTHIVYSIGKNTDNTLLRDRGIGMTYVHKNTTFSAEYHVGAGKEWTKYYSPITRWNSWIFSLTQRF